MALSRKNKHKTHTNGPDLDCRLPTLFTVTRRSIWVSLDQSGFF